MSKKDVPEGCVEVEVIIDNDGNYKAQILRHGKKTACLNGKDKCILDGLTGDLGEALEWGHTDEHYEETKPQRSTVASKNTPFDEPKSKNKQKNSDLGHSI